jgi:hypothetical protein
MPRQMTNVGYHQCTIWNYAGFRLPRILISRTIESRVRLPTACPGLVVDLWAFLLERRFHSGRRNACGEVVHSLNLRLRRARAQWHVEYEEASRRYE